MASKKTVWIIIAILVVAIIAGVWYYSGQKSSSQNNQGNEIIGANVDSSVISDYATDSIDDISLGSPA